MEGGWNCPDFLAWGVIYRSGKLFGIGKRLFDGEPIFHYHATLSLPARRFRRSEVSFRTLRDTFGLSAWTLLFAFPACLYCSTGSDTLASLFHQARTFEGQGEWDKACETYEEILRRDRGSVAARHQYRICLQRYWQFRRHRDDSYRQEVLSLDYGQALRLYAVIRDTLLDSSLQKKKVDAAQMFAKGLAELDAALADPLFRQQYLPGARFEAIDDFRGVLRRKWGTARPAGRAQANKLVRDIALAAQNALDVHCTVVIMEFACGSCYALDEYTLYLTPNQLRELVDSLRGEFASVGLLLALQDGRLVVQQVAPYSPAAQVMPPLIRDDQVLAIDRKPVAGMSLEAAQTLLDGPVGTMVELEVFSPQAGVRTLSLRRRATFLPSVRYQMQSDLIGYVHLSCFQDTTVSELDQALAGLAKADMKALILDLRGNSGGLFDAAIDSARRFLAQGIVTSIECTDSRLNTVYHARNPQACTFPLVVLVDGQTASAAEVLAGALKENKRARLLGATTFGKGCTQCLVKLPGAAGGVPTGGLRLTVARFHSPSGRPYTGKGVVPDVIVEIPAMPGSMMNDVQDFQLEAALVEAQRLLEMPR